MSENVHAEAGPGPRRRAPAGGAFAAFLAATGTELRLRLRSPASGVALAAFALGAWFWLPPPQGRASSIAWTTLDGRLQAPVYNASYVGFAAAELSSLVLALVGYYLVAGSIRRDRSSGVGAILAASPLSSLAYLGAQLAAHAAFLVVVAFGGWLATGALFALRGTGGFDLGALVGPLLLVAVPLALFVASTTLLFEVTPGLAGRGGLVAWFFFFLFGMVMIPAVTARGVEGERGLAAVLDAPLYDPAGIASLTSLLAHSLPAGTDPSSISSGYIVHPVAPERVAWGGITITPAFQRQRLATALLAALPFAAAVLIFDRFDPARRGGRRRRARRRDAEPAPLAGEPVEPGGLAAATQGARTPAEFPRGLLGPAPASRPSLLGAIVAETRLLWIGASWLRWPLLGSALALALVAGESRPLVASIFLVLLAALLGDSAAREAQAGTATLVAAQPSMPRWRVLWKAAAAAGFVAALLLPAALRLALVSPASATLLVASAAWIGGLAAATGALTGGGKLFAGLHLTAWYLGLNGLDAADWTGLLTGRGPGADGAAAVTLGVVAVMVAAMGREAAQARG